MFNEEFLLLTCVNFQHDINLIVFLSLPEAQIP